jgi:hypothetical protein
MHPVLKLTSSQRWAIGAVSLCVLIACSPNAPEEPTQPAQPVPPGPQLSSTPPSTDPALHAASAVAPIAPPPETAAPGYAGAWALKDAECATESRTWRLNAEKLEAPNAERSCKVNSLTEDHPTGRSAIYTVKALCQAGAQTTEDTFRFEFGASDTVMQMRINDAEPVRYVRCPA